MLEHLERHPHDLLAWQAITSTNRVRTTLNTEFQARLNPRGETFATVRDTGNTTQDLRVGDMIVVVRNDYETGIMNGQTGIIEAAGHASGSLTVTIEGARLELGRGLVASHLRLGYVITVHNTQGSAWPTIFSVEEGAVWRHVNRLYYTAVTRAEQHVVLTTSLDRAAWWVNATSADPLRNTTLRAHLDSPGPPNEPALSAPMLYNTVR